MHIDTESAEIVGGILRSNKTITTFKFVRETSLLLALADELQETHTRQ
jgi:hypothetical protein